MTKFKLTLFSLLLIGCASSQIVERIYEPYTGGTVKYLNQGADFVIEKRIADAKEKMEQYCNGSYQILKESRNSEFSGVIPTQYFWVPSSSEYSFISFKCI